MTTSKLLALIFVIFVCQVACQDETHKNQLHRTFSNDDEQSKNFDSTMRALGLIFTGVVSGILLFLCIMYNFKWRR